MLAESLRSRLSGLGLALVILCCGALVRAEGESEAVAPPAGEPNASEETIETTEASPEPRARRAFWLGLNCEPASEELRAKLKLGEAGGLVVEDVLPHSPAKMAGLEPGDVLVKAGDAPLARVEDLIAAVEAAGGSTLALELFRGEENRKVDITPAPRPRGPAARREGRSLIDDLAEGLPEGLVEGLQEALRGLGSAWQDEEEEIENRDGAFVYRLGPGVVLGEPMPDDLSITITRKGRQIPSLIVERGSERWELSADQLESLPDDIRPFAERMLGPEMRIRARLGEPAREVAEREMARARREMDRVRRRLHERGPVAVAPRPPVPPVPPGPVAPPAPGQPAPPPPADELVLHLERNLSQLVESTLRDLTRRIDEIQHERVATEERLRQQVRELEARLREREPEVRRQIEQLLSAKGDELRRMVDERFVEQLRELDARIRQREPEVREQIDEVLSTQGDELRGVLEEQINKLNQLIEQLSKELESSEKPL